MNRRIIFSLSPALLFLGIFVHPDEPTQPSKLFQVIHRHQHQWLLAHLLLIAGITLFIPVLLALSEVMQPVSPRLSRPVAVLGVAGCGAAAAMFGASAFLSFVGNGQPREMIALLSRINDGGLPPALTALVIGTVTAVTIASTVLAKARRISPAAAALTAAGFIGGGMLPDPFACIGAALTIVGLTFAAKQLQDVDRQVRTLPRESARV